LATVEVKNLEKRFGALRVLDGVTFDVRPGETVCVWGPSGAGKSTLLHIVGLMTPSTGGDLVLFGQNSAALSDAQKAKFRNEKLGFLFQFHHLLPDLSLLENVMMPLLIRGAEAAPAREKAQRLLNQLGLGARLDHRPSQASGGEQQRAALARALIGEPGLLLADEPTGNLDRANGREVEKIFQEEAKARGAAVILVTHNESLAAQADRVLTLEDGKIKEGVPL